MCIRDSYEGVDQRAIDLVVDEEISLGDFVLTGGEVAAMALIDAVARYVPVSYTHLRKPLRRPVPERAMPFRGRLAGGHERQPRVYAALRGAAFRCLLYTSRCV